MKYAYTALTTCVMLIAVTIGCSKYGSGPDSDTKAKMDAIIVTETYNAVKENPDDGVVPNSTKHKREDCPHGGWITNGDGNKSRCPDCDPPWNTQEDILAQQIDELKKQAEEAEAKVKVEQEARLKAEAQAKAEAEAKTQFEAEVKAREDKAKADVEAKAKLDAEKAAADAAMESLKAGVAVEQNDPVPSVGEQLAIEEAKMKLERQARADAEAKAAAAEAKVKDIERKVGITLNNNDFSREVIGNQITKLDNDARYNLLREQVESWNAHWKAVKAVRPETKLNKEKPGKGEGPDKPPAVAFDPALDWRLPPAERKRTFEEAHISWKTPNKKCCPDCTCEECYCMYPGQCLVEANGGNPVTKYTTKVERQCSNGTCRNVTVQVPRITYQQPTN